MKCICIDDEPLALKILQLHCEKTPTIDYIGSFLSVVEAIHFMNNNHVDLVFLDINMPEINGLDVKNLIPNHIQIVFATAYEDYALKSYDLGATDYLLKPISFERFFKAVQRCNQKFISESKLIKKTIETINKTLIVREDKKITKILIEDINYIEGLKDYAKIYFDNNNKVVIRERLKRINERLESFGFIRVHRSYIVPMNKISSIYGNTILVANKEIPINKLQRIYILNQFKKNGILGDRSE